MSQPRHQILDETKANGRRKTPRKDDGAGVGFDQASRRSSTEPLLPSDVKEGDALSTRSDGNLSMNSDGSRRRKKIPKETSLAQTVSLHNEGNPETDGEEVHGADVEKKPTEKRKKKGTPAKKKDQPLLPTSKHNTPARTKKTGRRPTKAHEQKADETQADVNDDRSNKELDDVERTSVNGDHDQVDDLASNVTQDPASGDASQPKGSSESHLLSSQARRLAEKPKRFGDKDVDDFVDHCMVIQIHKSDPLRPHPFLEHPSVRVHIIDLKTKTYIEKKNKDRAATTLHEMGTTLNPSNRESRSYPLIPAVQTQPSAITSRRDFRPSWEEEIYIDEEYNHIVTPDTVMLFEIVDFSPKKPAESTISNDGYYRICWGFLRLVGSTGLANTEKLVRIQLYQHPGQPAHFNPRPPFILQQVLDRTLRKDYPSTLHVTIRGVLRPERRIVHFRSYNPFEDEHGQIPFEEMVDDSQRVVDEKEVDVDPDVPYEVKIAKRWLKYPTAASSIPNTFLCRFNTGSRGCLSLQFSPDGEYLAAGCADESIHHVRIYTVKEPSLHRTFTGHHDVIHEITWSLDGTECLTASSDYTAKIWRMKEKETTACMTLLHTSYVYTARYNQVANNPRIIVTGAYDRKIRLWNRETGVCLQEITQHEFHINSIIFNKDGTRMYSADGGGAICIWGNRPGNISEFQRYDLIRKMGSTERLVTRQEAITCLRLHPSGRRMLIQSQNHQIRTVELQTYHALALLTGHINSKHLVKSCFSTDGRYVLSGSEDGKIFGWDADSGKLVKVPCETKYLGPLFDIVWHPHGNIIAICSYGSPAPINLYHYVPLNRELDDELDAGGAGNDFQERVRLLRKKYEDEMKDEIDHMLSSAKEELLEYERNRNARRFAPKDTKATLEELAERRRRRMERRQAAFSTSKATIKEGSSEVATGLPDNITGDAENQQNVNGDGGEVERQPKKPSTRRLLQDDVRMQGRRPRRRDVITDDEREDYEKRTSGVPQIQPSEPVEELDDTDLNTVTEVKSTEEALEVRMKKVYIGPAREHRTKGSKRDIKIKDPSMGSKRDPSRGHTSASESDNDGLKYAP